LRKVSLLNILLNSRKKKLSFSNPFKNGMYN
jgi:hypothetical protein